MLGQLLGGRYQVLKTLGGGSFGQTYLAADRHRPDQPQCVVKHLKPAKRDPSFLPKARSLFQREAATLEKLGSHDQIPRLLAYFEQDQEFYLVQEFIPGHVLRSELPPGCHWSEPDVVKLLTQVLTVLDFIHDFGVIHRDIKPENLIRRQPDAQLVLIDFGAVKQVQAALEGDAIVPVANTIAIGTPGYMSPEQAQGRPRPNSDLYALGIIALQALTGQNPSQLTQNSQGEISWHPDGTVSPGLVAILQQMVRYHFHDRYQSARDVLQALRRLKPTTSWLQRVGQVLRSPVQELWTPDPSQSPTVPSVPSTPSMPSAPPSSAPASLADAETLASDTLVDVTTSSIHVFISAQSLDEELNLAQQFAQALTAAGHHPFVATPTTQLEAGWAQRVDGALKAADYFLLLLTPESARSEVVLEEVRTVRQLHQLRPDGRPIILPIRVNFPRERPLNYELRGYLQRVQQRFWRSPADTPILVQEILAVLSAASSPAVAASEPITPTTGSLPTVPPIKRDSDAPPLPVAEPELPEGQVDLASAFYIERPPIEARCGETIVQPGALIRIKAPRQMGKTSLMARILHYAGSQGHRTVSLSLQLADGKVFTDLDKFLRWLCASVSRRLRLPNRLADTWDDIFGSKYNCTAYFEEYLLPELNGPLTLGLDEVDRVFEYPEIANDFFGLLRAWHEEAKNQEIWKQLRLIVVHATEVYIPLNTNQSPFNVGLPIELPEFTVDQMAQLAQLHQLNWSTEDVEQLQTLIGGHPYLVRLALYHIARQDVTLAQLLEEAPTEAGLFRDHLRGHWWNLRQHPELATAFQSVVTSDEAVALEPSLLFKLYSLGLIQLVGNEAQPRCDLYRQYFSLILGTHASSSEPTARTMVPLI